MIPAFLNLSNFEVFALLLIFIVAVLLPVLAIVKAINNKGLSNITKLFWILVIVFAPFLGAIVYLIIGNKPSVRLPQHNNAL